MRRVVWTLCVTTALSLTFVSGEQGGSVPGQKGGTEMSGPYEADAEWPLPIDSDLTWGRSGAVFAESPNRVFVMQSGLVPWTWKKLKGPARDGGTLMFSANNATHCASTVFREANCRPGQKVPLAEKSGKEIPGARWDHILMIFDRQGTLVESWEQHNDLFTHPHNITISPYDPDRHVWVVDAGSQQVFKFTNDGKLVMTLGEFRVAGTDKTHFGNPNGIAFLPNGDFYVSDGYANTRVIKFSKDGQYLFQWGKRGTGPGEFATPHGIAIDAKGRVYVIDRSNSRIQVFDLDGKFLEQWPDIRFPLYIAVSQDEHVWVSEGFNNKMLKYDSEGHLVYSWGTFGVQPGNIWGVHSFDTDSEGNLYVGEVFGGRTQKLRPRKGADPQFLMGPLVSPGSLPAK
jgi:peptidylamidoglycolate lyase